jgi:carbon storage regulator
MLILSRKPGETLVIDGKIRVKVIRVEGDVVKLGIEAPAEISIHRQEVYDEIQKNNKEAVTAPQPELPRLRENLREKNKQSQHNPEKLTAAV